MSLTEFGIWQPRFHGLHLRGLRLTLLQQIVGDAAWCDMSMAMVLLPFQHILT